METKEWSFMDKTEWGEGPWMREPDKRQFVDVATGLPCLIHRNHSGALCGYVGVTEGHPLFGQSYSTRVAKPVGFENRKATDTTPAIAVLIEALREDKDDTISLELAIEVHGGLTYSGPCRPVRKDGGGVCHVPDPGEPDNVWWFGFDCAHAGDAMPQYNSLHNFNRDDSYRDIDYVTRQCGALALQLKEWTA